MAKISALCRQQRVLAGRPQSHAPATEAQKNEERGIDRHRRKHHQRRASRNASAADERDGGIGELERLQRVQLCRRPDQHDQAAQQNADRDTGDAHHSPRRAMEHV